MSKSQTARENIESLKRQQAETKLQEVSKTADVEMPVPVIVETDITPADNAITVAVETSNADTAPVEIVETPKPVNTYVVQTDVAIPDTGFANGRESKGVPALVKALAPPRTDENGDTRYSSFAFPRNAKKAWRRDGSKRYAIIEAAKHFGYEVEFRQMDKTTDRVFRMK